jgi:peptidoglycan/xylan/chitin deacetylase (PgdA/CDA1 family)
MFAQSGCLNGQPRMTACLKPVRDALDNARAPVPVFIRDDDAGWDDERLVGLLDLLAGLGLPVDLAAIPTEVGRALARELCERIDAPGPPVGVHQHGLAHVNHEREGRKAEFGSSRSAGDQRRDILEGRGRLGALLGGRVAPIFTPPWNRCSAVTAACLGELGFRVLSRDAAAPTANVPGLTEVPIHVDWFARRKGERLSRAAVAERMAADITRGAAPLGVMLHHAVMDERERASAGELLALLADHPMVRPSPMLALAEPLTDARGRDVTGAAR